MNYSVSTHNGEVTIHNPATGNHRTFRIKTQKSDAKFRPGERIISLLIGSDNEYSYKGFGFVNPKGAIYVWKKYRGNWRGQTDFDKFAQMLTHPKHYEALGVTYQFSTTCRRCNRKLTTPVSIKNGIGPVCEGRS